jgi:tripartite-type tricarboxylate transporter receptor subunit TctC
MWQHRHALAVVFACTGKAACAAGSLHAQERYPVRPVRLVVPFPPGGGTDVMARHLEGKMSQLLGQPLVVDIRQAYRPLRSRAFRT